MSGWPGRSTQWVLGRWVRKWRYFRALHGQAGQVPVCNIANAPGGLVHTWKARLLGVAPLTSVPKEPQLGHLGGPPRGSGSTSPPSAACAPRPPHSHSLGVDPHPPLLQGLSWRSPEGRGPVECRTSRVTAPSEPAALLPAASHLGAIYGVTNHLKGAIPCPGANWPPKCFTTCL